MKPNERVLAVYQGKTPDKVPLMLDLSHWYKKNYNIMFDLTGFKEAEPQLVALHKKSKAVLYIETSPFYDVYYENDVQANAWTDEHGYFNTVIKTPLGTVSEQRVFNPESYSYPIHEWLIKDIKDLEILTYAMAGRRCRPRFDRYYSWEHAAGEYGFPYAVLAYSGLGFLLSRYMGIENTITALYDYPDQIQKFIDTVNESNLRMLDSIIDGPFQVLIVGDNHDVNVQSPRLFNQFTRDYYIEVVKRVHDKGKFVAVHVDGEMKGLLKPMAECGLDCIDAATPAPMFSLTPEQARQEAGSDLILSGGIPATVFGNTGSDQDFIDSVKRWLDTRYQSSRLILAAGDQVPTDAPWYRIEMLAELVDEYGTY